MNEITTALTYKTFPARSAAAASTNDASGAPVLILLHGRGTDENDLAGLVPFLDPRFDTYAVRAPFAFDYGGFTWFTLDDIEGSYDRTELEHGLKELIEFAKQAGRGGRKVFLFGFSMGAMMALAASLTRPALFAGVVAHSGLVPEQADHLPIQWDHLDGCAFFIAHGLYDPTIPIHYGRRARDLFARSNADVTYREYPIGHEISPESLSEASAWLTQKIPS